MFGYVLPPLGVLPPEEAERFRGAYCGLCRALGRRYGQVSRLILNYDLTYLAILLSDGKEEKREKGRCLPHPVHGRAYLTAGPALDLAADGSVILAYWQARDGIEDRAVLPGLPYRAAAMALRTACERAAERRPVLDRAVREQLARLGELERESCPSLDLPADCFASLLAAVAGEVEDPLRRRVLEQLLYHLGRWIYLVDAADDLAEDHRAGRCNPAALRYGLTDGRWTPEARREFALTLDHSIHRMAAAFELGDFGVWRPLLEATIYTGFFQVGKAVLDGTFHTSRRRDRERNQGDGGPPRIEDGT